MSLIEPLIAVVGTRAQQPWQLGRWVPFRLIPGHHQQSWVAWVRWENAHEACAASCLCFCGVVGPMFCFPQAFVAGLRSALCSEAASLEYQSGFPVSYC